MPNQSILKLPPANGGEASIFSPHKWPAKYAELMQNCYINERGNPQKIPGYSKVNQNNTGFPMYSGHEFIKLDGTRHLLAGGGGNVFRLDPETNEFGAPIQFGLTDIKFQFTTFNDICIISNGIDPCQKTSDGLSLDSLGGGAPSSTFKTFVHKGRLWFLERGDKTLASHSALNDPETQEGFLDLKYQMKQGDEILDGFSAFGYICFVLKNHVIVYAGDTPSGVDSDFAIIDKIDGMGAIETDTIQTLGLEPIFLSTIGIKTFSQVVTTGGLKSNSLSANIDNTLQPAAEKASVFSSAHYPKLGWYLVKMSETIRVFDYINKAWYRIVGAECNGMFTTQDGRLFFMGHGFMYEYGLDNVWDFAGEDIDWKFRLGWLTLSQAGRVMTPKLLKFLAFPEEDLTLTLKVAYDMKRPTPINIHTLNISPSGVTRFINSIDIDGVDDPPGWDEIDPFDGEENIPDPTGFNAIDPFNETQLMQYKTKIHGRGDIMQLEFSNTSSKKIELADIGLTVVPGRF